MKGGTAGGDAHLQPAVFYIDAMKISALLFCATCILLAGCASLDAQTTITQLIIKSQMIRQDVSAGPFVLTTYSRIANPDLPLRVYIEGDGRAWINRHQISPDPTPITATGLLLATVDDWPNVVYIARPCQFRNLAKESCDSVYWTNKRFSEEVVVAVGLALDHYLEQSHTKTVELIGYSGGAAIAALLAARRQDIGSLRTVAGNLDHDAVNRYHHVSPMPESLNPMEVVSRLYRLPQRHFAGEQDTVVPIMVAEAFVKHQADCARITVVPDATHNTGWLNRWPVLLKLDLNCDRN